MIRKNRHQNVGSFINHLLSNTMPNWTGNRPWPNENGIEFHWESGDPPRANSVISKVFPQMWVFNEVGQLGMVNRCFKMKISIVIVNLDTSGIVKSWVKFTRPDRVHGQQLLETLSWTWIRTWPQISFQPADLELIFVILKYELATVGWGSC